MGTQTENTGFGLLYYKEKTWWIDVSLEIVVRLFFCAILLVTIINFPPITNFLNPTSMKCFGTEKSVWYGGFDRIKVKSLSGTFRNPSLNLISILGTWLSIAFFYLLYCSFRNIAHSNIFLTYQYACQYSYNTIRSKIKIPSLCKTVVWEYSPELWRELISKWLWIESLVYRKFPYTVREERIIRSSPAI